MVECLKRKRGNAEAAHSAEAKVHQNPVKRDLLTQVYTTVLTLREYALLKLPSVSRLRRKKLKFLGRGNSITDIERRISCFLDSTLICSRNAIHQNNDTTLEQWLSFSQTGDDSRVTLSGGTTNAESTQAELVDFVIWLLFKREKRPGHWPKHLLCDGYRKRAKQGDPTGPDIPDIYSLYPNHHAASLKREPWPHILVLLGQSGQNIMLDLLTERSIFVVVEAGLGNYYQLSGLPLSELDARGNAQESCTPRGPADIVLVRSRIFYGRPTLTARGRVQHGYKHIHVLNQCAWDNNGLQRSRIGKNDANTAKLMMYMFPRQFGLHNVFTTEVHSLQTAQKLQDYTIRDEEIFRFLKNPRNLSADGTAKLPKRLRGMAWNLVQRLQTLHSRCSYTELLRHYCPSELRHIDQTSRTVSKKAVLQKIPGPRPKRDIDRTVHPEHESHAGESGSLYQHDGDKPGSFVDLATSQSQVSSFCQAVLSRIVPNDFWGQGQTMIHNKTAVLRQVNCFVRLRRFESISLHEIIQGLRIADIAWLQPPQLQSQKTSQSDMGKRHEIMHEFLYFVFDSLLMPLIKSNFYVTEASTHRNQVFYFRHDIWRRIASPAISILKRDMFETVKLTQANSILDRRRLGFSSVRLLPKGNKLRPIMNLRRRQLSRAGSRRILGPSINSVLSPIHTALKFEKDANPLKLGSTLFSVNDMYARLKNFKKGIEIRATTKLYFAKLDVQSAFDTIPQAELLKLMQSVPSQSTYTIIKHAEVWPGEHTTLGPQTVKSKAMRKWRALVLTQGQDATFTARLHNGLATKKRDTVFIDGVAQKGHETSALLHLMTDHIERNLVKFGKKYYRQKRGIPQGSILSSFLCNYFYADLERKHLGFLSGPDCLLMRLTDDFLLITLDKEKAVKFVETMHRGLPDYGVRVSPQKTVLNFPMSLHGETLQMATSGAFPYCGTCINDATLEITKDGKAAQSTVIANALTVEYSRAPGQNFHRKILNAFKIQSHLMFFDTAHNSTSTVLESLRHAFYETARKMVAYIRCLARARRPRPSLVIETMCKVAHVAYAILTSNSRRLRYPDYVCTIRRGQVTRWGTLFSPCQRARS
ncbi:hypothetical protein E4U42_003572 [Claviceps africana]|uniref:Telomerase reverse transcriptase n=1 Tax=Claviceps africana TaxID=83212 RepID=A0A8K0J6D3_9HYPO|nr:hypothetical protein E4U42_003572 [Claviceps africana]